MNTEQTSKSTFIYNPLLPFFTLFIDSYFGWQNEQLPIFQPKFGEITQLLAIFWFL